MSAVQGIAAVDQTTLDAYSTSGTSPGLHLARPRRARSYDNVHLVGPGAVGRSLLRRLAADRRRVIAVTDSTATIADSSGLDVHSILRWKEAGRSLSEHPRALRLDAPEAVTHIDADIVADCTSSDPDRDGWTAALGSALHRGACVAAAAKSAWCEAGAEWTSGEHRTRVGCNAVLGGTGRRLLYELDELQRGTVGIAIVGNASTTTIIESIERGGTLADGIATAQKLGYLEPDPELDLRGSDAAVKLAIVAGLITARRIDPRTIDVQDIRSVDPILVQGRARRGATTRLVARRLDDGALRVSYEEVPLDSLLAVQSGHVVYEYRLARGERRFHFGTGIGADATASALWSDLCDLGARAALTRGEVA